MWNNADNKSYNCLLTKKLKIQHALPMTAAVLTKWFLSSSKHLPSVVYILVLQSRSNMAYGLLSLD